MNLSFARSHILQDLGEGGALHSCQIRFSSHPISGATTNENNAQYYGCIYDVNMQEYVVAH